MQAWPHGNIVGIAFVRSIAKTSLPCAFTLSDQAGSIRSKAESEAWNLPVDFNDQLAKGCAFLSCVLQRCAPRACNRIVPNNSIAFGSSSIGEPAAL
jgi:hypothetical protein